MRWLTVVLKAASDFRYLPCYQAENNLAAWDGTSHSGKLSLLLVWIQKTAIDALQHLLAP